MRKELQAALMLIGLGMSLVVYAHATFATKKEVESIGDMLKTIDKRVYDIHTRIFPGGRK